MENPFLKAIDVLKERGWHQGQEQGPDGSVCLLGAVGVACTGNAYMWGRENYHLVSQTLGLTRVGSWNDDPERTEEDVILALKHAAEAWEADHA